MSGLALKDCGEAMKQLSEVKDSLDNIVSQNFIEPLEHLKNKELKEINVRNENDKTDLNE